MKYSHNVFYSPVVGLVLLFLDSHFFSPLSNPLSPKLSSVLIIIVYMVPVVCAWHWFGINKYKLNEWNLT